MYEFNSRVRYSEIDHHGTLTLPAPVSYTHLTLPTIA